MPVLHTNPSGPDVLALIEELGLQVSEAYAVAEIRLLRIILDRVNKDLDVTRELERVTALSDLARQARDVLAGINVATLVEDVVKTAVSEGELSAVARLNLAPAIRSAPVAGFSAQQAQMVAQIGAQLQGGLTAMSPTITRSVQDVYQRVIGEAVQQRIIGNFTQEQTRRIAVDKLLSNGLTGFVDKAGRQWKMGTYAEMATRTVASRAYDEAHIARINASDIHLVTIIVGTGADAVCVNWAGKVLSTNGQTGAVQARNPLTGEPETVIVAGSLDQARAAGWKHVGCRCTVVAYMPGLPLPATITTYDPAAEKARQQLRLLERRKRAALAQQEFAPDDIAKAQAKRRVTAANKAIADHVREANIPRQRVRESLTFQNGKR